MNRRSVRTFATVSISIFFLACLGAISLSPTGDGVGLFSPATAAAASGAAAQVIEGAKKEGQAVIKLPSSLAAKEGVESTLNQGVNKMWGLNLKIRVVQAGAMDQDAATVISELDSGHQPSWDAVVGTGPTLQRLARRGGIENVNWPQLFPHITPRMIDKALNAVILTVSWYMPYYNTKAMSKEDQANLPKRWEDFLDPRWHGKMIHPLSTRQQVILARVWGEEKTLNFVRQLVKQDLLIARFPEARSRLFAGERPLAYHADHPTWITEAQARGAPVKPILDLDPWPAVYFMQAVTKNARHPNAAKLALAYVVTSEFQQYVYKLLQYGSPFVPGSPIEKLQREMEAKGVRFVTFGDADEDEKRNREYDKIFGF